MINRLISKNFQKLRSKVDLRIGGTLGYEGPNIKKGDIVHFKKGRSIYFPKTGQSVDLTNLDPIKKALINPNLFELLSEPDSKTQVKKSIPETPKVEKQEPKKKIAPQVKPKSTSVKTLEETVRFLKGTILELQHQITSLQEEVVQLKRPPPKI